MLAEEVAHNVINIEVLETGHDNCPEQIRPTFVFHWIIFSAMIEGIIALCFVWYCWK